MVVVVVVVVFRGNGCAGWLCGAFLGLTALVTAIQATSHAAGEPWLNSLTDSPPHHGPDLPFFPQNVRVSDTAASLQPDSTAAVTPPSDGLPPGPTPNSDAEAADRVLFQWGLSPSHKPKSFTSSDSATAEQEGAHITPHRSWETGSGPDSEGPSSRRTRDLSSDGGTSVLTISKHPLLPDAPEGSTPPPSPRASGGPSAPPFILSPPPEILAPSYSPFFSPHPSSALSEPTDALPVDLYPTNTMDVDWGSGEYMETMSYLGSEGDDYSLVSNLPSDMYDLEVEFATESYDTSFPTRVGLSLSSSHPRVASSSPGHAAALTSAGSPASAVYPPLSLIHI